MLGTTYKHFCVLGELNNTRAQQQADQDRIQEERNRKSNERSMQPPKKRTGRQVMFRSAPIRRTIEEEKDNENQEDLDELKYLS